MLSSHPTVFFLLLHISVTILTHCLHVRIPQLIFTFQLPYSLNAYSATGYEPSILVLEHLLLIFARFFPAVERSRPVCFLPLSSRKCPPWYLPLLLIPLVPSLFLPLFLIPCGEMISITTESKSSRPRGRIDLALPVLPHGSQDPSLYLWLCNDLKFYFSSSSLLGVRLCQTMHCHNLPCLSGEPSDPSPPQGLPQGNVGHRFLCPWKKTAASGWYWLEKLMSFSFASDEMLDGLRKLDSISEQLLPLITPTCPL